MCFADMSTLNQYLSEPPSADTLQLALTFHVLNNYVNESMMSVVARQYTEK